ncbi:hypothetical protein DsansV1_C04g0036521 [Dioscorea sansibarensis]
MFCFFALLLSLFLLALFLLKFAKNVFLAQHGHANFPLVLQPDKYA